VTLRADEDEAGHAWMKFLIVPEDKDVTKLTFFKNFEWNELKKKP